LRLIEQNIGKKAITELVDMQPGDVEETYADIDAISNDLGYSPTTSIDIGIAKLIDWYKSYYGQK
jgi:UDP-glucuronate 4-epimerase